MSDLELQVQKHLDALASTLANYLHVPQRPVHAVVQTEDATCIYLDKPELAGHITRRVEVQQGDTLIVVDHATRGPLSVELIKWTSSTPSSETTTLRTLSST